MSNQVLVVYATKYGATAEIATKIGDELREAGIEATVSSVKDVDDINPYNAIILGSGVYIGKWRKEAVKFLQSNQELLSGKAVWVFSSGPTGKGEPETLLKGWRFPKAQQALIEKINPVNITVFHGSLDEKELSGLEKWMINKVDAPTGDFRDWKSITEWAQGIANQLK